jgi:hypothetical protein
MPGVKAEFVFDPKSLASTESEFADLKSSRKPAISLETKSGKKIKIVLLSDEDSLALEKIDGKIIFEKPPKISVTKIETKPLQSAGPAREIPLSIGKSHIALAPIDDDWMSAAVWKITLPKKPDLKSNPILRIRYIGDAARLLLNGKLIDDNFYCGREFDLGLSRYAPEILTGDLRLEILPLRKDAPIFFEPKDAPDFGAKESVVALQSVEIISSK